MRTIRILRWTLIVLIIVILGALAGWYLFLQDEMDSLEREYAGRGGGLAARSFAGRVSSTYENIVSRMTAPAAGENREQDGPRPRYTTINRTPVTGIWIETTGSAARVRFVERSTGNVLEASGGSLRRLTNTLLPRAFETRIIKNDRAIIRYEEEGTVVTIVGEIATSSPGASEKGAAATIADEIAPSSPDAPEETALIRTELPDDIRAIAASPDGEEIFYIIRRPDGAYGFRGAWDGSDAEEIFSSAIAGWRIFWLLDGRIVLVQNASDGASGHALAIEESGEITPLLESIPGLTALPHPAGRAMLYGQSDGALSLFARIDDTAIPALLPVRTVPEKCVWAPAPSDSDALVAYCAVPKGPLPANFLDAWYRGEASTNDAWWRIDARAATAELLYAPNRAVDVKDPVIDEAGRVLAFINAHDGSLHALHIEEDE